MIDTLKIGAVSGMIAIAAAGMTACETVPDTLTAEQEDQLYLDRFNGLREGRLFGPSLYSPRVEVIGTREYSALPRSTFSAISSAAIENAERYAEANNSTSLLIWQGGGVAHEVYFQSTSPETFVNAKSLAKPLSVIAVGRAIKEGFIPSLDSSASDFITEWKGTPKAAIKVRHLLDMRAGLLPQSEEPDPNHVMNKAYLHPRHAEIIVNEYPLVNAPGSRYEYSNATSQLVAVLIERATGRNYQDWVGREVLHPIGAKGGEIWLNREGGTAHSGCCILLPAESFFRLAILLLQDGSWNGERLLPKGFVDIMRTPTPQNPHAGMGVYVAGKYIEERGPLHPDRTLGTTFHSEPYLAADLFLFDGNGNQSAYIIPSADLVIFRSGNWPEKPARWDHSVLPNTVLRGTHFPDGKKIEPQRH